MRLNREAIRMRKTERSVSAAGTEQSVVSGYAADIQNALNKAEGRHCYAADKINFKQLF